MKRYFICLFLFIGISIASFMAGFIMRRNQAIQESLAAREQSLEAARESTAAETKEFPAANQSRISNQYGASLNPGNTEEYYLVCEDGFLLVFLKDRKTICLYTHIPISEFPTEEQARIRDGIWFESMLEIFNYLESYTS